MDQPQQEMSRERKVQVIARTCHEANRTWCAEHGDATCRPWFDSDVELRTTVIRGVESALQGKGPEEMHELWVQDKTAQGWVYGHVKDAEKKTHPCLVPYDRLPLMDKTKDKLFLNIVAALAPALFFELRSTTPARHELTEKELTEAERPFFDAAAKPEFKLGASD